MEIKRKIKRTKATPTATSTFYCYFCSRHILITFVGMTLLIVNYGVNTVQMSAVPHGNENCNNSSSNRNCISSSGNNVVSSINGNNLYNNKNNNNNSNISRKIIWKRSIENITNINSNRNTNLLHIALPTLPATVYKINKNADDDFNDNYANSKNNNNNNNFIHEPRLESNMNTINHKESHYEEGKFVNLRKSRFFGLLGSNFSLSYNLSLNNGASAGNITVVAAPAPAYYYAPAPYYPYGYSYYNPYGYYNPYAYNPYGYNPYGGYGYYR